MININQHNYEEFFQLYVDGELSAKEKQIVEQFIQANPGLATELDMFLQMQLPPETVVFDDKFLLYRNGIGEINHENYEEEFLLYIDNELALGSREKVETFVLQNPALQEAFTLLQKTKLEHETIQFHNKEFLYRNESKEKPVFFIGWQRIAIAASILGIAVLLWTLIPENIPSSQSFAKLEKNSSAILPQRLMLENPKVIVFSQNSGIHISGNRNKENYINNSVIQPVKSIETKGFNNVVKSLLANNEGTETTSQTIKGTTVSTELPNKEAIPPFSEKHLPESITNAETKYTSNILSSTNFVQQVVYKELETEDENKSIFVGALEINKDKLRGFFRKAGSIFKRKNVPEDEKQDSPTTLNTHLLK